MARSQNQTRDNAPGLHHTPRGFGWMPQALRTGPRNLALPWLAKLVNRLPNLTAKRIPLRPYQSTFTLAPIRDQQIAPDGMPVPPKHLWHGYADDADRFLEIGRHNVETLRDVLRAADRDIEPGDNILDFGCGAAPMLRCLRNFAEQGQAWGVDLSSEHVWWCRRALGAPFRFLETSTAPHLPFTDALFDLAYCGSVFSHIPDQADAWLCELARVIKPGGSLYATFLPIDAMHRYLKDHPTFGFSVEVARAFDADTLEQADFDLLVCERSPVAHVVYREEVFIAMCEQAFEVVSLTPNAYTFQSAVLLRRR